MKMYIICFVPVQVFYLGKIEAKMLLAIQIVGFLNQVFL